MWLLFQMCLSTMMAAALATSHTTMATAPPSPAACDAATFTTPLPNRTCLSSPGGCLLQCAPGCEFCPAAQLEPALNASTPALCVAAACANGANAWLWGRGTRVQEQGCFIGNRSRSDCNSTSDMFSGGADFSRSPPPPPPPGPSTLLFNCSGPSNSCRVCSNYSCGVGAGRCLYGWTNSNCSGSCPGPASRALKTTDRLSAPARQAAAVTVRGFALFGGGYTLGGGNNAIELQDDGVEVANAFEFVRRLAALAPAID